MEPLIVLSIALMRPSSDGMLSAFAAPASPAAMPPPRIDRTALLLTEQESLQGGDPQETTPVYLTQEHGAQTHISLWFCHVQRKRGNCFSQRMSGVVFSPPLGLKVLWHIFSLTGHNCHCGSAIRAAHQSSLKTCMEKEDEDTPPKDLTTNGRQSRSQQASHLQSLPCIG